MVEGFKHTEVGVIPNDWEVKSIREIADVNQNGGKSIPDEFVYIDLESVTKGNLVKKNTIKKANAPSRAQRIVFYNDILFQTVRPYQKNNLHFRENGEHIASTGYAVIRSKVDAGYLYAQLHTDRFVNTVVDLCTGTSYPAINPNVLASIKIPFPPTKAEQTGIATALNDADALINQLEQLLTKKRNIKTGAMQELLTCQKRIGTFNDEWITVKLGQIGEFKNGINKGEGDFGFGYPFINLMDVFEKPTTFNSQNLGLINSTSAERKTYELKDGDVIFVRSSVKPTGVGLTTVINKDLENTVYSGFLIRFRDDGTLNKEYKVHCFFEEGFRKKIIESSTVSANTNINQSVLKMLEIKIPSSHDEQTAIAKILSAMDNEIQELERKLMKYKMLKQGMMQSLLTGKIRLTSKKNELQWQG